MKKSSIRALLGAVVLSLVGLATACGGKSKQDYCRDQFSAISGKCSECSEKSANWTAQCGNTDFSVLCALVSDEAPTNAEKTKGDKCIADIKATTCDFVKTSSTTTPASCTN